MSPTNGKASSSISTTTLNASQLASDAVDKLSDELKALNDFHGYEYSEATTALPSPTKVEDKLYVTLPGKGTLFITGDSSAITQDETTIKRFTNVKNQTPAFLYLKYYARISRINENENVIRKAYVSPTVKFQKDKITCLPLTPEPRWSEVVLEIDAEAGSNSGMEIGVMGFKDGDYFLVQRFALIHCEKSPSFEEIVDLFEPDSATEVEVESEPEVIPIIKDYCYKKMWRCIVFPFALLVNIFLWPVLWCCQCFCSLGYSGRPNRREYDLIE